MIVKCPAANNQLARLDNTKIIDIITKIPNLTEDDRHELSLRVASDDVEIRKGALEKITQSHIAQHDLVTIMGELTAMSKHTYLLAGKHTSQQKSASKRV